MGIKLQKKHVVTGIIGIVTIAGAIAYWQYTKLMNYAIKPNGFKAKSISKSKIDFDLFVLFTNKSDLKFNILYQEYKVYINDIFISEGKNQVPTTINPNATSNIGVSINFNPEAFVKLISKSWLEMLAKPSNVKIKIVTKLKVKLWVVEIAIPIVTNYTLQELLTPNK